MPKIEPRKTKVIDYPDIWKKAAESDKRRKEEWKKETEKMMALYAEDEEEWSEGEEGERSEEELKDWSEGEEGEWSEEKEEESSVEEIKPSGDDAVIRYTSTVETLSRQLVEEEEEGSSKEGDQGSKIDGCLDDSSLDESKSPLRRRSPEIGVDDEGPVEINEEFVTGIMRKNGGRDTIRVMEIQGKALPLPFVPFSSLSPLPPLRRAPRKVRFLLDDDENGGAKKVTALVPRGYKKNNSKLDQIMAKLDAVIDSLDDEIICV